MADTKVNQITFACDACGGHGTITAGADGQIVVIPCACIPAGEVL